MSNRKAKVQTRSVKNFRLPLNEIERQLRQNPPTTVKGAEHDQQRDTVESEQPAGA
jgi:hypothetical protein